MKRSDHYLRLFRRIRDISVLALIGALAWLLCSCRANRSVTESAQSGTVTTASSDSVSTSSSETARLKELSFLCDSLGFVLRADSIVTPGGATIYRPEVEVAANRPSMNFSEAEVSESEVSESVGKEGRREEVAATVREEDSGAVAVASEPITNNPG